MFIKDAFVLSGSRRKICSHEGVSHESQAFMVCVLQNVDPRFYRSTNIIAANFRMMRKKSSYASCVVVEGKFDVEHSFDIPLQRQ